MPWKGETDPYRIWLSEIILQQTRVEQGKKYYERFIATYPAVADLAAAPEKEVFKLWEGLGYYSRCRNLITTAKFIAESCGGKFPDTYASILALPGVGPYTAAAIASFAFGLPCAVVDGNVQRVLARYFGLFMPATSSAVQKCYRQLAAALLDASQPGSYNQAIMDFGAVICTPRQPSCSVCVQSGECQAFRHGWVARLPARPSAPLRRVRWFYYFVVRQPDGRTWLRQRTGQDIWNRLYEFPLIEDGKNLPQEELLATPAYRELFSGRRPRAGKATRFFRQQLTHQTICACFIPVELDENTGSDPGFLVVEPGEAAGYPFPRLIVAYLHAQPPPQIPLW